MPDSPAYLARDRAAYIGSHSFVLLIGVLALAASVAFLHDPNAPAYVTTRHAGLAVQWITFAGLGAGGLCVTLGLVLLYLPAEAVGHVLLCASLLLNGVMQAISTPFGFDWMIAAFSVVFTVICILFRLWAIVQAARMTTEIHEELEAARTAAEQAARDPDEV